jgi:hypothetical protein
MLCLRDNSAQQHRPFRERCRSSQPGDPPRCSGSSCAHMSDRNERLSTAVPFRICTPPLLGFLLRGFKCWDSAMPKRNSETLALIRAWKADPNRNKVWPLKGRPRSRKAQRRRWRLRQRRRKIEERLRIQAGNVANTDTEWLHGLRDKLDQVHSLRPMFNHAPTSTKSC